MLFAGGALASWSWTPAWMCSRCAALIAAACAAVDGPYVGSEVPCFIIHRVLETSDASCPGQALSLQQPPYSFECRAQQRRRSRTRGASSTSPRRRCRDKGRRRCPAGRQPGRGRRKPTAGLALGATSGLRSIAAARLRPAAAAGVTTGDILLCGSTQGPPCGGLSPCCQ